MSDSLWPHRLQPSRFLCPREFPGKNTGKGCHFLLQRIFLTHGSNLHLLHLLYWQVDSLAAKPPDWLYTFLIFCCVQSLSCVWLFATLWTVAHQCPPFMYFSRQEYWKGLPFPTPVPTYIFFNPIGTFFPALLRYNWHITLHKFEDKRRRGNRRRDDWMASLTQWTWGWVDSRI